VSKFSEKQAGCDKQLFLFCLLFNNKRLHSAAHKTEKALRGNKTTSLASGCLPTEKVYDTITISSVQSRK